MMTQKFKSLYQLAKNLADPFQASDKATSGQVGCALVCRDGVIYTGVSVNTPCGIGFCGEHAAIAEMLKNKTATIDAIISVDSDGGVMTPCGRCRQLMLFLHRENQNTNVYIDDLGNIETLSNLMPYFKGAK